MAPTNSDRSSGSAGCPSSDSKSMFLLMRERSDVALALASSPSRKRMAAPRPSRAASSFASTSMAAPNGTSSSGVSAGMLWRTSATYASATSGRCSISAPRASQPTASRYSASTPVAFL